jgi:hypothetical protein
MSEQVSSQPPDHEPEAQPAADEPQADHPPDEPKAEAGKPEPETPKPGWWRFWRRQREQRGRPENRFSVLTALISAAAALVGATVGGVASYMAAQSQVDAQFRVSQANNAAQANQALITRRQTAYSDLISAEEDLEDGELRLHDAINDFKPPNIDPVKAAFKQENDIHTKWLREVGIVQIVDSTEVDHALDAIIIRQIDLSRTIQNFMNQVEYEMTTVDESARGKFFDNAEGLHPFVQQFLKAAKRDISGQS